MEGFIHLWDFNFACPSGKELIKNIGKGSEKQLK